MTPTPEPGQPVWIEAEVVPSVAGHPMLTPITADGQPSMIRLAPARYRWQPVPPQPPVLGDAGDLENLPSLPVVAGVMDDVGDELTAAAATLGRFSRMLNAIQARLVAPLADVPGPDDSTPPPEPDSDQVQSAHTGFDAFRPGQFRTLIDGDWVTTNHHMASHHHGERRPVERLDIAWSPWWPGKSDPVPSLDDPQADAWEATARRACAKLDELVRSVGVIRPWLVRHGFPAGDTRHLPQQAVDALEELHGDVEAAQQAPVQATTHREAGEAQERVQGDYLRHAAFVDNEGKPIGAPRIDVTAKVYPVPSLKPAVQGAGRDWRGEISRVLVDALRPRNGKMLTEDDIADAIVAALGLHDLEQADATALDVSSRRWSAIVQGLRAEIVHRKATEADLRAEVSQWHATYGERALRDATRIVADLDAARRELEQLRGENARLRRRMTQLAEDPRMTVYLLQQRLRSALDAGAPATQDGDPK